MNKAPMIRIGIEGNRAPVMARVRALGAPILVSAQSLWDDRRKSFSRSWRNYEGIDVALDSGGFTAMQLFGGYRFSVEQYAALAAEMRPSWWAQMDFCCEPEIAADPSAVARRIDQTAQHLQQCRRAAADIGAADPLIVLQGWKPDDYCHGPAFDDPAFQWPALVGVGSVCRRKLNGADGLIAVISALDRALPSHVRLHLFGVKGAALSRIGDHPRFASMDSMAWSRAARWRACERQIPCDGKLRAEFMETWRAAQLRRVDDPQMRLF